MADTAPPPLTIATTTQPGATQGSAYSQTLAPSGDVPGYTWSIALRGLPPGLTLASTGTLSGIPTVAGSYAFTVEVPDSTGASDT